MRVKLRLPSGDVPDYHVNGVPRVGESLHTEHGAMVVTHVTWLLADNEDADAVLMVRPEVLADRMLGNAEWVVAEQATRMALVAVLKAAHKAAGSPTTRSIAAKANSAGCPISHSTVARIFNGKRAPSWEKLSAILDALGAPHTEARAAWEECVHVRYGSWRPLPGS